MVRLAWKSLSVTQVLMLTSCVPCPEDAAALLENAWRVLAWIRTADCVSVRVYRCMHQGAPVMENILIQKQWRAIFFDYFELFSFRAYLYAGFLCLSCILVLLTIEIVVYYSVWIKLDLHSIYILKYVYMYILSTHIHTHIYTPIYVYIYRHTYAEIIYVRTYTYRIMF